MGGEIETGDVMRDAPDVLRKKMEGKDGTEKQMKNYSCVCVWMTVEQETLNT